MKSQIIVASAGTGKTYTLIHRILKLLLLNNDITKILIITFTNAAIQEIHERLSLTLKSWQKISLKDLQFYITEFGLTEDNLILQKRASKLFEQYINNIDSIQIKTIHAFATWVLSHIAFDKINKFDILTNVDINKLQLDTAKIQKFVHFSKVPDLVKEILAYKYKFKNLVKESFVAHLRKIFFSFNRENSAALKTSIEQHYFSMTGQQFTYQEIVNTLYTQTMSLRKNKKLEPLQNALHPLIQELHTLQIIENSIDILHLAQEIIAKYEAYKKLNSFIDYDDIIYICAEILKEENNYYLYQIYNYFDHILIDEAQDTSVYQWQILYELIKEISYSSNKTFFVVGDPKQSIFSFQGAYSKSMQKLIELYESHSNVEVLPLLVTYRNSINIVNLVNSIFSSISFFNYQNTISHLKGGLVKIITCKKQSASCSKWPLINGYKKTINSKILAIASIIKEKIQQNYLYSDIMIIFQRRNSLYYDLIDYLQKNNIFCKNPDKEPILSNKYIQKILYLFEFVLNPHNDYAATQLLFIMQIKRRFVENIVTQKTSSIWNLLQEKYKNLASFFLRFIHAFAKMSYEDFIFFSISELQKYIVIPTPIINNFMNIALSHFTILDLLTDLYENNVTISVQDASRNAVSIMTAHASKGLEAKIVILADTGLSHANFSKILWLNNETFIWNINSNFTLINEIKILEKKQDYEEYMRLLYVAITRAKLEFYAICDEESNESSWSSVILKNTTNTQHFENEYEEIISIVTSNDNMEEEFTDLPYFISDIPQENVATTTNQEKGILLHKEIYQALLLNINSDLLLKFPLLQKARNAQHKYMEHKILDQDSFMQIDLLFIDNDTIFIIDYKLQFLPDFLANYQKQLNRYAIAVQEYFTNLPIRKFILCLTTYQEIELY